MTSLYPIAFGMSFQRTFRAPTAMIMNSCFYIVLGVMVSALWRGIVASTGGSIAGYDETAIVWYVVIAQATFAATRQGLIEEIGEAIRNRSIESEMLHPVSIFGLRYATELGAVTARLLVLLPIATTIALINVGVMPDLSTAPLVVIAALFGIACNVAGQHIAGAIGFWLGDTEPAYFVYQKLVFLIGCMLLPPQVLPDAVQDIIWSLPFWAMAYAPARLASGHFEPWLIAAQVAWLIVLIALGSRLFAIGERRLQRTGG